MNEKPQIRYNAEMRKAIMMGDEYDAFKTLTQFYREERKLLVSRRDRVQKALEAYQDKGGTVEFDEETRTCVMKLDDTSYTVTYDEDGRVAKYAVEHPDEENQNTLYLHWAMYCSLMSGRLDAAIDEVDTKLSDLENDYLIKSVAKTAGTIADDVYLTAGAVAGLDLRTDDDVDPFGILGKKGGGSDDGQ